MRTSIHVCVEKKTKAGKWSSIDKWKIVKDEAGTHYYKKYWDNHFFTDYNPAFIEFMTGVGKEGFKPISPLKGLPTNLSNKVQSYLESWGEDAHSHSWLLLSDFVNFDWESSASRVGYLPLISYPRKDDPEARLYNIPFPHSLVTIIPEEEMIEIVEGRKERGGYLVCKTTWQETYARMFPWLIRELHSIEKEGDPEDIRMVFWLDN